MSGEKLGPMVNQAIANAEGNLPIELSEIPAEFGVDGRALSTRIAP